MEFMRESSVCSVVDWGELEDIEEDVLKSCPLQMGTSSGMEALSPRTAEAETEGMCGLALTVLLMPRGW